MINPNISAFTVSQSAGELVSVTQVDLCYFGNATHLRSPVLATEKNKTKKDLKTTNRFEF